MIFVDTSAWFASFVRDDADHFSAVSWRTRNRQLLVTTDFILDEVVTLLRVRNENVRAIELGEGLLSGDLARLVWVQPSDVRKAWGVFKNFQDKGWSFTDCVSRIVMERLEILEAFAFDQHFRQFGRISVVP